MRSPCSPTLAPARAVRSPGPDGPRTSGVSECLGRAGSALRSGGLVLAGPAGSGKTHLAALLAGSGPARRVRADRAACRVPFGAFLPLLGTVPSGMDRALVLAHRALASPATPLVVDDAHLLDDLSATLVSRLAGVVPVLVTLRTGSPVPDPVTALWKDGVVDRIDLPRPTSEDCATLVEGWLGGRLRAVDLPALVRLTGGNLTWLRQLVADERAAGRLRPTAGIWHRSGRGPLGAALLDLVTAELGDPPADVLEVLELVALAGRLDTDALADLTDTRRVEEAAERGLIAATPLVARPAHPLYAAAVVQRMSPPKLRRLCARVVGPLRAGAAATRQERVRLGWLAMRATRHPDPELLLAAARAAAEGLDASTTVELADAAGAAGAGFEADLLGAVGRGWAGPAADAGVRLREVADSVAGDPRHEPRLAQPRAVHLALDLMRPAEAHAVLDAAIRPGSGALPAPAELLGVQALLAALDDRLDEARSAARQALTDSRVSAPARAYAGCALTLVAALTGEIPGAPVEDGPCPPEAARAGLHRLWSSGYGAGLAGRLDLLHATIERCARTGPGALVRHDLRGWQALVTGRIGAAVRLLEELRTTPCGPGGGATTPLELRLAMASGMAGDAPSARAALDRARSGRHPAVTVFDPQLELARAWVCAAEGSVSAAVRHTRLAARAAAGSGQFAVEMLVRHTAVGFGEKGHAARLSVLARRLRGPRASAAAAHAAALDAGDDTALLAAAVRFADAGLMLLAAEAAAQAEVVARERLDPAATAGAARATAGYLAGCDGARTPALEAAARPLGLSGRQREIAALVAGGLSNRQIGERLGVSVRTVEGHVYHACVRLDVPNRAALAALLDRPAARRDVA